MSGNGYDGLIAFYRHALKIKKELFDRFVDIVFIQRKGNEKVVPVLKDGENLYPIKS